jgi:AraC-like DNA-binding protein
VEQFRPFVRYARKNEQSILPGQLQAVDHRLFYCHSGSGSYEILGQTYSFLPGTVLYIPAGVPYRLLFGQEIPVFSGCNFDFYQGNTHLSEPIPPVASAKFQQEDILEKQIFAQSHVFARPVFLENAFSLEYQFLEIAEEFQRHNLYCDDYCSAVLNAVLIRIAQIRHTRSIGIDDRKGNAILSYVHTHYDSPMTNRQIAEHFGYHENYISTLVRKFTGMPLHRYLLRYRMHVAVGLLQSTDLTVGEVAARVAMPDIKHFSKCFKNVMGVPPSHFRAGTEE